MRQRYIDKTQQDGICVTGVVRKQEGDLIWSHDNKYPLPETILDKLKELLGHTRLEVFMGALIGILTALLVVSIAARLG